MDWHKNTKIIYVPQGTSRSRGSHVWRKVFLAVFCILILTGVLYGGYRFAIDKRFFIDSISLSGAERTSENDIRGIIQSYFDEKTLGFIPRQEYFAANTDTLSQKILQAFPGISAVSVDKQLPNKLTVSIHERAVWGVICVSSTPNISFQSSDASITEKQTPCWYTDDQGFAFGEAPLFVGSLTKKIFIDAPIGAIGQTAVSPAIIHIYDGLESLYQAYGIPVIALQLSTEFPQDIHLYTNGWYTILDKGVDVNTLGPIIKPLFEKELAGKFDTLQYIDLRFGNKVFYKFKSK